jgi:hypothetical protein
MALVGSIFLFLLAVASTWLTYKLKTETGLPTSDIVWLTVISLLLWAGFVWSLDRAINPRRN